MPSPAVAHHRQRRVGAVEEPEQVDVDHRPPLVRVGALDRAQQHHAGVVDQDVEAAHLLGGAVDERAGRGLVADVDLECASRAALATIRSARPSSRSLRRAPSATAAPSRANASAVASPIPDEAPVITALRPSSEPHRPGLMIGYGPGVAGSAAASAATPSASRIAAPSSAFDSART